MTHSDNQPEVSEAPAFDAENALRDYFAADTEQPEEEGQADGEADKADAEAELDLSDESDNDAELEEQEEAPAIAPPVSLNADEKAKFAQLPPEAQQLILDVEARRNADVTKVTTRAAEAQRAADAAAAQADAMAKAQYAQQLEAFAQAFEPVAPSPDLAYSDPQRYIAEKAQFDALMAQHNQLVQQITGLKTEATQQVQQMDAAARERELMSIPEFANPETRQASLETAMATAKELGIPVEVLAQNGDASDFKALLQAAQWKDKAAKYDKAMARQMQKVRAQKGRTLRPNAAQPESSGKDRAVSQSTQRLRQSGSVDDAAAAIKALIS